MLLDFASLHDFYTLTTAFRSGCRPVRGACIVSLSILGRFLSPRLAAR